MRHGTSFASSLSLLLSAPVMSDELEVTCSMVVTVSPTPECWERRGVAVDRGVVEWEPGA